MDKIKKLMEENRRVFAQSGFFHPLYPAAAAQPHGPAPEVPGKEKDTLAKPAETSDAVKENPLNMLPAEDPPMMFEERFDETEALPAEIAPQAYEVQEISDELERLSYRYGRGMEEWLNDQSSL